MYCHSNCLLYLQLEVCNYKLVACSHKFFSLQDKIVLDSPCSIYDHVTTVKTFSIFYDFNQHSNCCCYIKKVDGLVLNVFGKVVVSNVRQEK